MRNSPVRIDGAWDVFPLVDNAERHANPVVILSERWRLEKTRTADTWQNKGTGQKHEHVESQVEIQHASERSQQSTPADDPLVPNLPFRNK